MRAFPEHVAQRFRVVNERIGDQPDDSDITIPLRADRGHVFVDGKGWAGVCTHTPRFFGEWWKRHSHKGQKVGKDEAETSERSGCDV